MRSSVDVHNFLVERDIPHELVPLAGRPRSPERIAALLGLPPNQVGRVVLYEAQEGPVAALVPAGRSPDRRRLARAARKGHLSQAKAARATDLTDFLHEALPPVGLPAETMVVMDRTLAEEEVLYFPGGEATAVLKIRSADLARATGAMIASIAR